MRALHWYTRKIHERSADSAYILPRVPARHANDGTAGIAVSGLGVIARLLWKPRGNPSQVRSVGTTILPAEVER
jgi:hypothetical protein